MYDLDDRAKAITFLGVSAVLAAVILMLPMFIADVWINFLTGLFIWVAMAWAWNLLAVAGYISLGVAAAYGLGAYSTAVLMKHFELPFLPSLLISGVWVAAASVVVAVPLFRLRSHYFIMGTFIIAEIVYLLMDQARVFGIQGASLFHFPPPSFPSPSDYTRYFYFVAACFLIIVFAVILVVKTSRLGLALNSIGQDESTAESLGVPTALYKLIAFGLSSLIFALAGGIAAYWAGVIQQGTVFTLLITVKVIVISILGGLGTFAGPILGAFVVQFLEQILGPTLADLNQVVYGFIVMLVVVLLPAGLVPGLRRMIADLVRRSVPNRTEKHSNVRSEARVQ